MNKNTDKITGILDQIRILKAKHAELAAATGEDFNIFSILHIRHREVQTHTTILGELLNPHGLHHQQADFLKLFLKKVCTEPEKATFCNNPESYQVRNEERIDEAQFDIMLENDKTRIVIENKIFAGDQYSQLYRLWQDAMKDFDGSVKLIYLTLHGSQPSKDSLKNLSENVVKCISV